MSNVNKATQCIISPQELGEISNRLGTCNDILKHKQLWMKERYKYIVKKKNIKTVKDEPWELVDKPIDEPWELV